MLWKTLTSLGQPKGYSLIDGSGPEDSKWTPSALDTHKGVERKRYILVAALCSLLIFTLGGCTGFIVANLSLRTTSHLNTITKGIEVSWVYNKTFSQPPSNETDSAWKALFPTGKGFIQHPYWSPNVTGLSVFHQLHCLDELRQALYAAKEGVEWEPHRSHHVRHCIDFLRQALMCHADTNLEPVNFTLGGITGWNSQRRCRDYGRVVEFANQWHAEKWKPYDESHPHHIN